MTAGLRLCVSHQAVKSEARFIAQALAGEITAHIIDDTAEVGLSAAEIKAICMVFADAHGISKADTDNFALSIVLVELPGIRWHHDGDERLPIELPGLHTGFAQRDSRLDHTSGPQDHIVCRLGF
jgi:hypothetical protein